MNDTVLTVLAQVAEQLGFLTPTGPADPPEASSPCMLVAYSGPATGVVAVAASRPLVETLARNLLALDGESPVAGADAEDALRELANVIAGNLLPALRGDGEYRLGPPLAAAWPAASAIREQAHLDCAEGTLSACCACT